MITLYKSFRLLSERERIRINKVVRAKVQPLRDELSFVSCTFYTPTMKSSLGIISNVKNAIELRCVIDIYVLFN